MIFKERELTRLSFLASGIVSSPELYDQFIDGIIRRGGSDDFINVLVSMRQIIQDTKIDIEKSANIMIKKGGAEQEMGRLLMAAVNCYKK